ncbi:hypothetical protein As57867_005128, partial [Aphanomyces stellatus]
MSVTNLRTFVKTLAHTPRLVVASIAQQTIPSLAQFRTMPSADPSIFAHNNESHTTRAECPFANLAQPMVETSPSQCPFHAHNAVAPASITHPVDLVVRHSTFITTDKSATLLRDIGGGDRIRECCTRFYARAFLDVQLKPFFFEDDGATAHGQRLADWIIEKMGGEGTPWSDSGRFGMRQPSHFKAWNCEKRDPAVRGDHFNLTDTRTWMRVHFWAARECGLDQHEAFWG